MYPYQYWLGNGVKIFSLQFKFLRPSIYDLKTDESDTSFLSLSQHASHHQTYTKFLQHTKPQNYLLLSYKYNLPYNMTPLYTIDHARITCYLRNYWYTHNFIIISRPMKICLDFRLLNNASVNECI